MKLIFELVFNATPIVVICVDKCKDSELGLTHCNISPISILFKTRWNRYSNVEHRVSLYVHNN